MLNARSNPLSLKRRVLAAGSWSLAGYGLNNLIRLGSSLVMTRLLVPEMFGIMTIAMLVMTGLAMFSDLGLNKNIVQSKRGGEAAFLNTAWVIQILRGVLLWLLGVGIALFVFAANHFGLVPEASVYADPLLPYVIAVVSISSVIAGLQSTKFSEASRRLSLGRLTQIQIAAQLIGLICMICWVLVDRSIWALVAGSICMTAVTTLLSHTWLLGVANRWQWDHAAFYEIFHFGKWMFISSILGFFANNADRLLLGGYIDSAALGIYSIAFTIVSSVVQILNKIISDVSFAAFSEVERERSHELKRSLYRFHIATASLTYFCSGALFVSGDTVIRLLYDPRYEAAGWMLQVLAIGLLPVSFGLSIYCLLARGLAKIFTGLIAVRVAATIIFIPLGFHFFGVPGALWAIVASQLSILPPTIYYQLRYDLFDLSKELLLLPTFLVGMLVGKGFELAIGR